MVYQVYSVKDRKVGFLDPQLDISEASAIRNLAMAVNSAPKDRLIGFCPKDFDLYCLGEFDSVSGQFTSKLPQFIVCAADLVGVDYEKET